MSGSKRVDYDRIIIGSGWREHYVAMKKVTFRTQTKGEIDDLMEDEGLRCALSQALIAALVGELLHYKEEGHALNPLVIYCISAKDVVEAFPGSVRYEIGTTQLSPDAAKQILKLCAPLASGSWHIFIERLDENTLKYGVFKYPMLPTTPPLHEMLEVTQSERFALLMRKTSLSSVEIRGSHGRHVSFLFSTVRDDSAEQFSVENFATLCCEEADGDETFQSYLKRMLERLLTSCHGTILICGDEDKLKATSTLSDAVWLNPPLDFFQSFKDYRSLDKSETLLDLQHLEELLAGLLNSDGMVVFDKTGKVLAYRMFYKGGAGQAISQEGGARRRAFEGVCSLIGAEVKGALFRPQDGNILFKGEVK